MNIIYFIASSWLLACPSGVFYRLGGASPSDYPKLPKWLVKGVTRDIGCTLCAVVQLVLAMHWFDLDIQWWQWAGYTAMSWWGCKSYWTWVNKTITKICPRVINKHCIECDYSDSKGDIGFHKCLIATDKHWWNWLLVGITMWSRWLWIAPWGVILLLPQSLLIMDLSENEDEVEIEEFGRGFFMII